MDGTRIEDRDAAIRLLDRLTFWLAAAALAAVGVFAAISAATIPGSASSNGNASATSTSTVDQSSSSTTNGLQPSGGGVSSAPSGSGTVATGASR